MPFEPLETEEWIAAQLLADADIAASVDTVTSRVFSTRQRLPVIKLDLQEASDLMVVNGNRVWTDQTYLVRAYTSGIDTTETKTLAARIDAVLHKASGTSSTLRIEDCVRIEPFVDTEVAGDKTYQVAGGFFRLHVQPV